MANLADVRWLKVRQAAEYAQCGPKIIYAAVAAGKLRAARIGGGRDIRILREWCDAWLIASSEPVEVQR